MYNLKSVYYLAASLHKILIIMISCCYCEIK